MRGKQMSEKMDFSVVDAILQSNGYKQQAIISVSLTRAETTQTLPTITPLYPPR